MRVNIAHLLHWSGIDFQRSAHLLNLFNPSWQDFKNSVALGMGILHVQTFTNSHFHFLIIVESVASQASLSGPNSRVYFPEVRSKRNQQLLCRTCAVLGCIFVLKSHIQ
jgi:hypothetical protein